MRGLWLALVEAAIVIRVSDGPNQRTAKLDYTLTDVVRFTYRVKQNCESTKALGHFVEAESSHTTQRTPSPPHREVARSGPSLREGITFYKGPLCDHWALR